MDPQKTLESKNNPEKKSKAEGIITLELKLYYKTILIKTRWYWHKNKHIDKCNKIKLPEIKPMHVQ